MHRARRPWRAAFSSRLSTSSRSPGSQPRSHTGVLGQRRRPRRRPGGATSAWSSDAATTSPSSTSPTLPGDASPRAIACSPSSRSTSRRCSDRRVEHELGALLGGDVRVAAQRRQRRLDARQRRAQLVARVGGEAARRRERALAIGRRAPEPREHVVEARGERAQLGRPVVAGHAPVEVLGAGDPGGRAAQAPQRAQQQRRREPRAEAAGEQRRRGRTPRAARSSSRSAALDGAQRARDLEAREAAEARRRARSW